MTRRPPGIQLPELRTLQHAIDLLRIRSIDPNLYLAEIDVGGRTLTLRDNAGSPLVFRSQLAAKKPFRHLGISRAVLVHASSYDEMIGLPSTGSTALEVPILCPDDDYS